MMEQEFKSAVRALGLVAVAMAIAGCCGNRGLMDAKTASPAPDFGSSAAGPALTAVADQVDDAPLTTIELRHFAMYNRFRAAFEAAAAGFAGGPFLTNAEAQHNWYSGGGATAGSEQFSCPDDVVGR